MNENAKSKPTDVVGRIVELLKDPSEVWTDTGYTIRHQRTGLQIWVTNCPILDTNTYPAGMHIGLVGKWRLWKAIKVARRNSILRILDAGKDQVKTKR